MRSAADIGRRTLVGVIGIRGRAPGGPRESWENGRRL